MNQLKDLAQMPWGSQNGSILITKSQTEMLFQWPGLASSFPTSQCFAWASLVLSSWKGRAERKEVGDGRAGQEPQHYEVGTPPGEHNGLTVQAQLSPGEDRKWIHCLSSSSREGREKTALMSCSDPPRAAGPKTVTLSHTLAHRQ